MYKKVSLETKRLRLEEFENMLTTLLGNWYQWIYNICDQ